MLEYNELQELMKEIASGIDAAECHGFITGYLCISDTLDASVWKYLCAGMEGGDAITERHRDEIYELGRDITLQLLSDEFDFELLQPDSTSPAAVRCQSLSEWCHGFLSGLGVAGTIDWSALSGQCQEMVSDLSEVARLDPEPGEQSAEEIEQSLTELGEYVRMGAVYIHDEFARLKAENGNPEVLH
jgi:hypothetical protein